MQNSHTTKGWVCVSNAVEAIYPTCYYTCRIQAVSEFHVVILTALEW